MQNVPHCKVRRNVTAKEWSNCMGLTPTLPWAEGLEDLHSSRTYDSVHNPASKELLCVTSLGVSPFCQELGDTHTLVLYQFCFELVQGVTRIYFVLYKKQLTIALKML